MALIMGLGEVGGKLSGGEGDGDRPLQCKMRRAEGLGGRTCTQQQMGPNGALRL